MSKGREADRTAKIPDELELLEDTVSCSWLSWLLTGRLQTDHASCWIDLGCHLAVAAAAVLSQNLSFLLSLFQRSEHAVVSLVTASGPWDAADYSSAALEVLTSVLLGLWDQES